MLSRKKATASCIVCSLVFLIICFSAFGKGAFHPIQETEFITELKTLLNSFEEKKSEERIYLMFDKPFYHPGETIWFQGYLRNGSDMKPSDKTELLYVEFIAPGGNVEKKLTLIARNGTSSGDIQLDENISGGLYKVKAYTKWQENEEQPAFFEKEIQIQKVVLPALKMKLGFHRESYGKGEKVTANLKLETLANKPLQNFRFTYKAKLKNKVYITASGKTDNKGTADIQFKLPVDIDSSDGLLNIILRYQGKNESISRSIPILLNNITLEAFPEGGDLVAGFKSKVAVRTVDEFGKPADIEAIVETESGQKIADFKTFHQGMGSFKFTPKYKENYYIKVLKPTGVDKKFPVPESLKKGYVLSLTKIKNNKITLTIKSTEKEELTIIAKSRGKEVKAFSFKAVKGENQFTTDTTDFPMGVIQVTLFDSKKIERAERLVFVNKNKQMSITIKTDKEKYLPREKVKMSIRVFDERELPMPAQLSLSVTDDRLISFADVKEGNILSKLLLEPDLKTKIFEPDFYFDPKEEKAGEAMDYLMLTHGWRRFVWKDIFEIDKYSPEFKAEKAEIRGVVLSSRYNGKPVSGAEVQSTLSGRKAITAQNGTFVFRNIDLYETETLKAKKGNSRSSSIFVSDYNSRVTIFLEDRRVKSRLPLWGVRAKNALPMAEGNMAVMDDEAVMVQEMVMPIEENKNEVKNIPDNMQVEEKLGFADEIIEDRRILKKKLFIPAEGKKDTPVYYRAKIFPAPVYTSTTTKERVDFRSTIFWKGNLETDRKGKAEIEFYNSDEITSFRSIVEGIGVDGLVGRTEKLHYTQLPFSIDIKIPTEVSMGDHLKLPVTIVNNSKDTIEGLLKILPPASWKRTGNFAEKITLGKGVAKTLFLPFQVLNIPGEDLFKAEFSIGNDKDSFSKTIMVTPKGFPVSIGVSSQEKQKSLKFKILNPVKGTVNATFTAYPSILTDLLKGIESILKEPYGCFEQTSSSTYPNIMVMQYMNEIDNKDVRIIKKAEELVEKGYKKLISFETKEKGYEWFGANPGHEALTAYGLMEFKDMQSIFGGVDNKMLTRTGNWILDKRDGKGGFSRNSKALDSFGRASDEITNAYIVYALSEAGFIYEIKNEVEKAFETAEKQDDPYQMALVCNALLNLKDKRASGLLVKLLKHQQADGSLTGKTHSVTRSTGKALSIETTALTVLAALKSAEKNPGKTGKAVKFIITARSPHGGFGNTQSTVLALKALVAYTKFSRKTAESGTFEVFVNGKKVATKSYEKGEKNEITISGDVLNQYFTEGVYQVEIKCSDVKHPLPYTFSINYNTEEPQSSPKCSVSLQTELLIGEQNIKTGDTIRLKSTLSNLKPDDGLPMTIAIIGVPGGLSPQPWQLKELQEKKAVDYYEVRGNNVIVYYRQMKPGEKREINLDLKAEFPGTYTGAASSTYLYYTNEYKNWVKGNSITINK